MVGFLMEIWIWYGVPEVESRESRKENNKNITARRRKRYGEVKLTQSWNWGMSYILLKSPKGTEIYELSPYNNPNLAGLLWWSKQLSFIRSFILSAMIINIYRVSGKCLKHLTRLPPASWCNSCCHFPKVDGHLGEGEGLTSVTYLVDFESRPILFLF